MAFRLGRVTPKSFDSGSRVRQRPAKRAKPAGRENRTEWFFIIFFFFNLVRTHDAVSSGREKKVYHRISISVAFDSSPPFVSFPISHSLAVIPYILDPRRRRRPLMSRRESCAARSKRRNITTAAAALVGNRRAFGYEKLAIVVGRRPK